MELGGGVALVEPGGIAATLGAGEDTNDTSAVVGVGGYVYVNQESIIESVKEKALGSIGGAALGGALGGSLPSLGNPPAAGPALPIPNSPF